MREWIVRLRGEDDDLKALAACLCSPRLNIKRDEDGRYYLRSSDFATQAGEDAIYKRAIDLIAYINGAATLLLGDGYFPVEYDAICRIEEDGRRYTTVGKPLSLQWRTREHLRPTSAEEVETLVTLADQDPRIAVAFHYFLKGNWFSLYKALEIIIKDVAGDEQTFLKKKWTTRTKTRRFNQTAQSRNALADEARHSSAKFTPPKSPMSLEEARSFVRATILACIRDIT